jgi:hypothetical protein
MFSIGSSVSCASSVRTQSLEGGRCVDIEDADRIPPPVCEPSSASHSIVGEASNTPSNHNDLQKIGKLEAAPEDEQTNLSDMQRKSGGLHADLENLENHNTALQSAKGAGHQNIAYLGSTNGDVDEQCKTSLQEYKTLMDKGKLSSEVQYAELEDNHTMTLIALKNLLSQCEDINSKYQGLLAPRKGWCQTTMICSNSRLPRTATTI